MNFFSLLTGIEPHPLPKVVRKCGPGWSMSYHDHPVRTAVETRIARFEPVMKGRKAMMTREVVKLLAKKNPNEVRTQGAIRGSLEKLVMDGMVTRTYEKGVVRYEWRVK